MYTTYMTYNMCLLYVFLIFNSTLNNLLFTLALTTLITTNKDLWERSVSFLISLDKDSHAVSILLLRSEAHSCGRA